jgi:hypothetical protein
MSRQTSGDTGLVMDVAGTDADEILIEGLPPFANGLVLMFLLE